MQGTLLGPVSCVIPTKPHIFSKWGSSFPYPFTVRVLRERSKGENGSLMARVKQETVIYDVTICICNP